jgi:hypothetical protein
MFQEYFKLHTPADSDPDELMRSMFNSLVFASIVPLVTGFIEHRIHMRLNEMIPVTTTTTMLSSSSPVASPTATATLQGWQHPGVVVTLPPPIPPNLYGDNTAMMIMMR